ncbi:MAG TPA: molybdate ABC transporter substrate-binding protein [Abditibacteriaceae bacterium]|nr:molybdate ABC transporter substrate-binding protein [Abditibacteriaceae bacterium]
MRFGRGFAPVWLALLACVPLACGVRPQEQPVELVVAAAASLKDVMAVIARDYRKQQPGVRLRFNFASSGTLQRQIEQGAPVDVFIAAADENMNELAARNLIAKKTRRVLAENGLVLIVPRHSRLAMRRFNDVAADVVAQVAVGGPGVPAGVRAEEVFMRLGIWAAVRRKAVRGKDVREVLTHVELGNVEAGVVYRTDAAVSDRVRIAAVAPASLHQPIRYPVAIVTDSEHPAQARAFVNYLASSQAKAVLRRYKFIVK